MPNPKRERQRQARVERQAQLQAARRKKANRNRAVTLVVILAVVAAVLFLLHGTGSHASGKSKVAAGAGTKAKKRSAPTATTAPATSTTAASAAKPLPCPPAAGAKARVTKFPAPPSMCISLAKTYYAHVVTDVGAFTITMGPKQAPKTVNNFVYLARYKFFDGIIFHRVIPGFVVQGGDPTGTGTGGPGYSYTGGTPKAGAYKIGSVAMANSGSTSSNGSQFFIVVGSQGTSLPPNYTLFGQVTSGMSVVQKIAADGSAGGTPKVVHKMLNVTITSA